MVSDHVVLIMIGGGGTVILQDAVIIGIANKFLPDMWGWIIAAIGVIFYATTRLMTWRTRRKRGITSTPGLIVALQIGFLALFSGVVVYVANQDRGVPVVGVLLLLMLVGFTFLAERTQFGRYVYAIGGDIRIGPARRYPRRPHPRPGLHDLEPHGRHGRHHPGLTAALGRHLGRRR